MRRLAAFLVVVAACSSGGGKAASTTATSAAPKTTATADLGPTTTLDAKGQFVLAFEKLQPDLLHVVQADRDVQTVNKVGFDTPNDAVLIDVTSQFVRFENQADAGWNLVQLLAQLWAPGQGYNQSEYVPGLHFVNSGVDYRCSADFMVRLATGRANRSGWETQCL